MPTNSRFSPSYEHDGSVGQISSDCNVASSVVAIKAAGIDGLDRVGACPGGLVI